MTLFRKILLGIGVVLLAAAAIGLALPRQVHVERSLFINASRSTVFTILNGYTHFNKWSPWAALDPDAKYTYEGPVAGVGAAMSWVGDPATMGSGSQRITESRPWEMVRTAIDFGPQGRAIGTFSLVEDGAGTMATWGFDTDLGMNPVSRYFGLMFERMIGGDFERGLEGLRKLAEGMPRGDFSDLKAELVEAESRLVAYTSASAPKDDTAVAAAYAQAYGEVGAFLRSHRLTMVSMPISINTKRTDAGYEFEPAIAIDRDPGTPVAPDSRVRVKRTYGGRALKVVHTGPYSGLTRTYEKMAAYLAAHGLQENGHSWDEWVDDPTKVPEAELRTFVWVPVK